MSSQNEHGKIGVLKLNMIWTNTKSFITSIGISFSFLQRLEKLDRQGKVDRYPSLIKRDSVMLCPQLFHQIHDWKDIWLLHKGWNFDKDANQTFEMRTGDLSTEFRYLTIFCNLIPRTETIICTPNCAQVNFHWYIWMFSVTQNIL